MEDEFRAQEGSHVGLHETSPGVADLGEGGAEGDDGEVEGLFVDVGNDVERLVGTDFDLADL